MPTRFDEIAVFTEVARKRSFVRASEQLGISVSAVSRAVAALECRLGVRLLQRTTRSVGLTQAGGAYFSRCEALLSELISAEAEASALGAQLQGRLRVSAATGLGMTHLVPALPEFLARHPRLTLDLHLSNRFVDLVEERFDLAIRVGTLADSRLIARRLAPSRRLLAATAQYLSGRGIPRHPRQLSDHACLVLDIGEHADRWDLWRRGSMHSVSVQGPLRSNHALAVLESCRCGIGIALLPGFVLQQDFRSGRLQPVLHHWATQEPGIFAIYPGRRFVPAKVRALVDYLAARLGTEASDIIGPP